MKISLAASALTLATLSSHSSHSSHSSKSITTCHAFSPPLTSTRARLPFTSNARNPTWRKDAVTEDVESTEAKESTATAETIPSIPLAASPATPSTPATPISPERLAKVTQPRPYPLFLAEKTAALFDFAFEDKPTGFTQFTSTTAAAADIDLATGAGIAGNAGNGKVGAVGEGAVNGGGVGKVGTKQRLLVLGTGWGAAAFLKSIDTSQYDVTVISPRNYFVFTPMLAGASVGTVEYRSIAQPIREINNQVHYLEAAATDIDPKTNTVTCTSITCEGNSCTTDEFTLPYDKLLLSVGARVNTFNTPGVSDYCNFLKQVGDAQQIKNAIMNCFNRAGLPGMSDEEKRKQLTFVVVGAGPTGVEFTAELLDFMEEDGSKFYGELLRFVGIKLVEAAPEILRPFDEGMREEAVRRLTRKVTMSDGEGGTVERAPVEVMLNKQVSEVSENHVYFKDGTKIPYGMSLWAAGIGPLPITANVIEALEGTEQESLQGVARGRVAVDPWLRVIGGEGKIFALGDCSCVESTPFLPATAQVASQQGEFLGKLLSRGYSMDVVCPMNGESGEGAPSVATVPSASSLLPPMVMDPNQPKTLSEQIASFSMSEDQIAAPFQYLDLGILAYTGSGSALAQLKVTPGSPGDATSSERRGFQLNITGRAGFGLWRSIYLFKQMSPKNAALVALDWMKAKLFGRDISIL